MEVDDLGPAARDASDPIVGRDHELEPLGQLVDGIGARGGAVVLRGEAGIGKSALLNVVAHRAWRRRATVTTTTGTPVGGPVRVRCAPPASSPFLELAQTAPGPAAPALDVALGILDGEAPDVFLVGLATLESFTETATQDPAAAGRGRRALARRASVEVLGFVARRSRWRASFSWPSATARREPLRARICRTPGSRGWTMRRPGSCSASTAPSPMPGAGTDPQRGGRKPAGAPRAASRCRRPGPSSSLGWPLPLTARLEATFAARLKDLDDDERMLLLLAALDDGTSTS